MTQTNEDLREKIKELFNDHYWDSLSKDRDLILGHCYFIVDEIMSLIPQPEQLEVKIKQTTLGVHVYEAVYYGRVVMKIFETKQEALDFCKRFNLKVINEVSND